jgi:anti-sigma regulatory factor (Ser/Thr protein kinase)
VTSRRNSRGAKRRLSGGKRPLTIPAGRTGDAVTRVVEVPAHFDDRSFDSFAEGFGEWPPEPKLLFDARGTQWASPYGLIGLLTAGQALAEARREKPLLTVPTSDEVKRYWARAGFFQQAAELFELHGKVPRATTTGPSDVLLDVTPVRASEDVHSVVDKISEGASRILHGELGLEMKATLRFSMALSEACQNIVEHAGTSGWVAVQAYTFRRRLGRRVVVIAVSDSGVGFRRSLESTHAKRFGERWGDGAALEAALIQGVSRFRDPGRGQGLAFIKRFLDQWEGKISIRSGTARLSIVPTWDEDAPLTERLAYFPGSQVQIIIPAQQTERP